MPTLRVYVIGLALIAFSLYIGIEIDYRHSSWVLFLIVIPLTLAATLIWLVRRKPRNSEKRR